MRSKIATGLVIAGLLSIPAWSGQSQTSRSTSVAYEYQVIGDPTNVYGPDEGLKRLNQLGAQGWEIVSAVQLENNPPMLYLKRVRRSR